MENPNLIPLYKFLLRNDWTTLQKDSLYRLLFYYESTLSIPEKVDHLFNKLDIKIQNLCTKTTQDVNHSHFLSCIKIINGGETFFLFDKMEYDSIKNFGIIPNAIKVLIDDYKKFNPVSSN
jgi:hypothetical protein